MIRKIIHIDEEKCTGCGLCAASCHEGAIDIVNGKARLARENFCDGFGDCLPNCPAGAITFEEREAPAYDEAAVFAEKQKKTLTSAGPIQEKRPDSSVGSGQPGISARAVSRLRQWPCQLRLAPLQAPYFAGADLLIAADCTAYAYANLHEDFMKDRITLIACPKLDPVNYADKLTDILQFNSIKSVTVVRMEVPCCGGLSRAVQTAIQNSGKKISCQVTVISKEGKIISHG